MASLFESEWKQLTDFSTKRSNYSFVAVSSSEVAIVGGYGGRRQLDTIEIWNQVQKAWTKTYKMTRPRSHCAAVMLSKYLYVFGGGGEKKSARGSEWGDPLATCERLDLSKTPSDCIPEPVPPLDTEREGFQAIAYNNRYIFIVGGTKGKSPVANVLMYDTKKHKWTKLEDMAHPRDECAVSAPGPWIVAAGGHDGTSKGVRKSAELYNSQIHQWVSISSMNTARVLAGGAGIGRHMEPGGGTKALAVTRWQNSTPPFLMVVAGGRDSSDRRLSSTEIYDSVEDIWSPLPSLRFIRGECKLTFVNGHLIAAGDKKLEFLPLLDASLSVERDGSVKSTSTSIFSSLKSESQLAIDESTAFTSLGLSSLSDMSGNQDNADPKLASVTTVGCTGPAFQPRLVGSDHMIGLFAAIYHGYMDDFKEVFQDDPKVDVNKKDSLGRTAADFAAIMGEQEMMDLIVKNGGKCSIGSKPTMRALMRKRALVRKTK